MSHLLEDFPPGPLDRYRKKASFDWKMMKVFLEGEDMIEYQVLKDLIEKYGYKNS